ncbi:hypothetical protein C900_05900 [Fulvivirga imtechensis AK7]|uniref:Uncharacterized protein n=1 Tax=Fulvivirga imtechensis AK7 TaxID=1237149 RepID=L8JMW1_9BACT|nr:hypothetical protein [Fulvivirga imtechensis]ELR68717.1 hypothetical protein C900_05900 [Fulvivirga imtechensis AK7]
MILKVLVDYFLFVTKANPYLKANLTGLKNDVLNTGKAAESDKRVFKYRKVYPTSR